MSLQNIKSGTVTGTGAAQNISLGWVPDHVVIANVTDGDVIDFWWNGMTAATSIKVDTAAGTRAASDGISAYEGSTTATPGFTIGAGISENAKVLRYTAMRNSQ